MAAIYKTVCQDYFSITAHTSLKVCIKKANWLKGQDLCTNYT